MEKRNNVYLILVNIVFSILYSLSIVVGFVGLGLFGMGCGADCSNNPFLRNLFLIILGVDLVLLLAQSLILHFLFKKSGKTLAGWILGSIGIVPVLIPIVFLSFNLISSIGSQKILKERNAPFYDAQTFHPRVTYLSKEVIRNSETNLVDTIKVRVAVSASKKGQMEITGGLYSEIQDENYMNYPEIRDLKTIEIDVQPKEIEFVFRPLPLVKGGVRPLDDLKIFGVYVIYRPLAEAYSKDSGTDYNPVDDVDDSGSSSAPVLNDFDVRSVFYSLGQR